MAVFKTCTGFSSIEYLNFSIFDGIFLRFFGNLPSFLKPSFRRHFFYIFLILLICGIALFTTCNQGCREEGADQKSSLLAGEKVKDVDGNVYSTVIIGFQEWMVENLKTTRLNDGSPLAYLGKSRDAKRTYCWYNNDIKNKSGYGALYSWHTVNSGKLAPKGWHVPDTAEWRTLFRYLGAQAINKLQDTGSMTWTNRNPDANNETGFKALPAGLGKIVYLQKPYYDFTGQGKWAGWWSGSEPNTRSPDQHFAFYIAKNSNVWQISEQFEPEDYNMSVRCLKNTRPLVATAPLTAVSSSSVMAAGNVMTSGGLPISSRGFCWYESGNPSDKKSKSVKEKGIGFYTFKLTGLKPGTAYAVKAFAKNPLGTAYGEEIKFVTKRSL